jgi:DNA-binding response OmpR family regulator
VTTPDTSTLAAMPRTVLLVEDDDGIAAPLLRTLEREGYDAERVAEGLPAVDRVREGDVGVMILDLGLPDIDGLEVCRRVRSFDERVGILVLTARAGELDRVVGLDVGADDYLAKPFGLAELLARLRAVIRRQGPESPAPSATADAGPATGLRVDTGARRVHVAEREVPLTSKEFDVLALLDESRGDVVTRTRLMDEVWDENWYGSTKTLDVTVGRLRQKLDDAGSPDRVVTVRGVGFRLEDSAPDA